MNNPINLKLFTILFMAFLLINCGGGSGDDGTTTTNTETENTQQQTEQEETKPAATVKQGSFDVSLVEGLSYESGEQAGKTDSNGQFSYEEGKQITFKVGDIVVGTITPRSRVAITTLVANANDETDITVTNIMRFLVTIDNDNDLSNGIQITAVINDQAIGATINFKQPILAFETDSNVVTLVQNMTTVSSASRRSLATVKRSRTALKSNLISAYSGLYDGNFSGDDTGSWSIAIDENGLVSGEGISNSDGSFTISGQIQSTGIASFDLAGSGNTSTGATYAGTIDLNGNFSGTWLNAGDNQAGTFSGSKQQPKPTEPGNGDPNPSPVPDGTIPTEPFKNAAQLYSIVNSNLASYISSNISIKAPNIAENAAVIPVTITSPAQTGTLWLFADSNPGQVAARFDFIKVNDKQEETSVRIKMAGTGNIIAVFDDGAGNLIANSKSVKVTIAGLQQTCPSSPCNAADLARRNIRMRARTDKLKMLVSHPMYTESYISSIIIAADEVTKTKVFFTPYISKNPYLAAAFPTGSKNINVSVTQLNGNTVFSNVLVQ